MNTDKYIATMICVFMSFLVHIFYFFIWFYFVSVQFFFFCILYYNLLNKIKNMLKKTEDCSREGGKKFYSIGNRKKTLVIILGEGRNQ